MTSYDFGVKLIPLVTFNHQSLTACSKMTLQTYDLPHHKPQEIKLPTESICKAKKLKQFLLSH
jgi:hypothetical protein